MSTLHVLPPVGVSEHLDDVVSRELRTLMGRYSVTQLMLGRWLGINQSKVSERLNGRVPWRLAEIQRLALGFGVHPAVFLGAHSTDPRPEPDGGVPIGVVRHQGLEPQTRWLTAVCDECDDAATGFEVAA